MKSKLLTDLILESMREDVEQFVKTEGKITSSTEYEDRLIDLSRKFTSQLVRHGSAPLPKSRNSKKSPDKSGAL
ncbi:MAG: hypothetical protein AAF927_34825 [Bacteroidota bacterium]